MSDPKPSKPILRRSAPSTKVPTILSVPDLRAKTVAEPDPVTYQPASDVESHRDSVMHVDARIDQRLDASIDGLAGTLPDPQGESVEPLVMDDLAAAAELSTDAELPTPIPSKLEPKPELATLSSNESESNWFGGKLRGHMGTIATIALTVFACTLVARVMKPNSTSDSFAQPTDVASVEEPQQQVPVESQQNPAFADGSLPAGGFAQTPTQLPIGNQQPQFTQQPQVAGQFSNQLSNATNTAQQFVERGIEAVEQQVRGVANQTSAGVTAILPQAELPNLPQLNAPAIQQNLRNAANQVNNAMQLQSPQHVAANPARPQFNTPNNNLTAPGNFNAQSNRASQAPSANSAQGHAQTNAMGQPHPPTGVNPADLPAHLFPQNTPQNQIIDPMRSANRFQAEPAPKTAQSNAPSEQASAYPRTRHMSLEEIVRRREQQQQQQMGREAPARVADQRGVNQTNANAQPIRNRFEANTYENGNQRIPGGVNP